MSPKLKPENEEKAVKTIMQAVRATEVDINKKLDRLHSTPRKLAKVKDITSVSVDVLEVINRIRYTLFYIKVAVRDIESLEKHIKFPDLNYKASIRKAYETRLKILHKEIDGIIVNLELYMRYWRDIRESGKLPFGPWNRYSNSEISATITNMFHKEEIISRQLLNLVNQISESLKGK